MFLSKEEFEHDISQNLEGYERWSKLLPYMLEYQQKTRSLKDRKRSLLGEDNCKLYLEKGQIFDKKMYPQDQ